MTAGLTSKLNDISTLHKCGKVTIYNVEYMLHRLLFEDDESNIFLFRPMSSKETEKVIDLDTGNALWPHNKGCQYMVYPNDFRTLAPYIYKIFIAKDADKLIYYNHVELVDYTTSDTKMYDFVVDKNVLSFGYEEEGDILSIKLSQSNKKLVLSKSRQWRTEDAV